MRTFLLLIASAGLALAQLDSYSVTITASRSAAVQPDQVPFSIFVETNLTTGLDDVLAVVQSVGLTAANLSSVTTQTSGGRLAQTSLVWIFTGNIPLTTVSSTVATLNQFQHTAVPGMTISFSLSGGLAVSPPQQASQTCSINGLMLDARNQAQQLAALAGFNLGPVLAMSNVSTQPQSVAFILGVFPGAGLLWQPQLAPVPAACTMVVKFALV